jgi:hypothetical protein
MRICANRGWHGDCLTILRFERFVILNPGVADGPQSTPWFCFGIAGHQEGMSFADDFNMANDVCKGHQKVDAYIKPTLTGTQ